MKKWIISIIVMAVCAVVGFVLGGLISTTADYSVGFSILFAVVAGFACVVHAVEAKYFQEALLRRIMSL